MSSFYIGFVLSGSCVIIAILNSRRFIGKVVGSYKTPLFLVISIYSVLVFISNPNLESVWLIYKLHILLIGGLLYGKEVLDLASNLSSRLPFFSLLIWIFCGLIYYGVASRGFILGDRLGLGSPNFAGSLILPLIIFVCLVISSCNNTNQLALVICFQLIPLFLLLLLTNSRQNIGTASVLIFCSLFFDHFRISRLNKKWLYFLPAVLFIWILVNPLFQDLIVASTASIRNRGGFKLLDEGRVWLWGFYIEYINKNGVAWLGSTNLDYMLLNSDGTPVYIRIFNGFMKLTAPHNFVLESMFNYGIIPTFVLLSSIAMSLKRMFKDTINTKSVLYIYDLGIYPLFVSVLILYMGLNDNFFASLWGPPAFVFWFLIGMHQSLRFDPLHRAVANKDQRALTSVLPGH